jgi:hypothetical protein
MKRLQRCLTASVVVLGLVALVSAAGAAAAKANHHNGQQLLGDKIKTNGNHEMHKKGDHAVSVEVRNGKVAGVHVKHAKKGEVPVTKYKANKKLAQAEGLRYAAFHFQRVQAQYLGTTYIGYAYTDEDGVEEIYWFPYDMILDGDTGAIEYVPAS